MKRLMFAIIALVLIVVIWQFQKSHEKSRISGKNIDSFLELNAEDINGLKITNAIDTFNLKLQEDGWYLMEDYPLPVDTIVINSVINASCSLSVTNIASENPERQLDFNVDDSSGIHVYFYNNEEILNEIIIGKPTPDYQHTYVRKPSENLVYIAKKPVTFTYGRHRLQWLDKTILAIDTTMVSRITFNNNGNEFRIEKQDSLWMLSKKPFSKTVEANPGEIKVVMDLIKNLRGAGFPHADDSTKTDFDTIDRNITIDLSDGQSYVLKFYKPIVEEPGRYFCSRDDYPITFSLMAGFYDLLFPDYDELKL